MVKIVESQKDFGNMNSALIRFSNLTEEDKKMLSEVHNIDIRDLENYDLTKDKKGIFMLHRKNMGEAMGFDGRRMFMADQQNKDGSSFELSRDYVEANPNGWTDIPEDILVVTKNVPRVVIGHPVADCPVVIMTDRKKGISALGHCSAQMIDMKLPMMIAEVLRSKYDSKTDDIMTYISACAGPSWTYDRFPKWATDMKVWEKCIVLGDDGLFHINLRPAILEQVISMGLNKENINFNMDDTITDPNYFSNSAANPAGLNDSSKYGRHFAGVFFTGEDDDTIEIQMGKGK